MSIRAALNELVKDTPLVGIAGAQFLGMNLNTWILVLGFIYGGLRVVHIGMTMYWQWKDRRDGTRQ